MKEQSLVKRTLDGEQEAFGVLVNRYQRKVFNLAYSMTRNRETADDLAQDIFIKAYCALKNFKFKSEFGTWIYRIAMNHIKDYLRSGDRVRMVPFEDQVKDENDQEDETVKMEHDQDTEQRLKVVHDGIRTLPEKYQIILSLRDIQGFSYKEISQILRLSAGTVDSRLHRARKMLKNNISPFFSLRGETNEM
jgi:RNA polymerase sigma-70 factor (ECF subfamily)